MTSVLRLSLPLTLWLASFSAVYGLHGLLCSSRWSALVDDGTARFLLVLVAAASITVQVVLLAALWSSRWRDPDRTLWRISLGLASVALVSTAWTLLPPVAVAQSCDKNLRVQLDSS